MRSPPDRNAAPPLDPGLYALDAKSLVFFKATTGIRDDDELKEHILHVQKLAYGVVPYPCIRSFAFTRVTIAKAPVYSDVLKLGQERKGALLLDVGCGFGNDTRKAALDGFPADQIVASDLRREFWDLGSVLFRSSPDSFPATFLAGDVFDPDFLTPFQNGLKSPSEINLSNVNTLNDLRGKFSAVWAGSFFHMFSEKDQSQLARALGSLLSPERGSILFGSHMALPCKGHRQISDRDVDMFCHDPESWKEMWVGRSGAERVDPEDNQGNLDGAVFPPDSVKVDAKLIPIKPEVRDRRGWFMVWSITRL